MCCLALLICVLLCINCAREFCCYYIKYVCGNNTLVQLLLCLDATLNNTRKLCREVQWV